jgi:hypothetical protein
MLVASLAVRLKLAFRYDVRYAPRFDARAQMSRARSLHIAHNERIGQSGSAQFIRVERD